MNEITFRYKWEGKALVEFLKSLGIKAWIGINEDRLGNYKLYYHTSGETANET